MEGTSQSGNPLADLMQTKQAGRVPQPTSIAPSTNPPTLLNCVQTLQEDIENLRHRTNSLELSLRQLVEVVVNQVGIRI